MKRFYQILTPLVIFSLIAIVMPATTHASGFSFYRTITVDHTKVPNTDQTSFPVLVSGTYSYLATIANGGKVQSASGYDIGFYSSSDCSTGKMNWETEKYSAADGSVVFWVQVPTLSHTSDTVFYICYGNSSITTDQSSATSVWDTSYKDVLHLPDGSSLTANDSTSNGNNGTLLNAPAATAGQIDGGATLSGTAYIEKSSAVNLPTGATSQFTIAGWVKTSVYNSLSQVFGFGNQLPSGAGAHQQRSLLEYNSDYYFWGDSSDWDTGIAFDTDNLWHYVVFAADASNIYFYRDGALRATGSRPATFLTAGTYVTLGNKHSSGASYFQGSLDDVRISSIARTADWIADEYNNQSAPSSFYSVGAETPFGSGAVVPARKMRLFEGFKIRLLSGTLKVFQQ